MKCAVMLIVFYVGEMLETTSLYCQPCHVHTLHDPLKLTMVNVNQKALLLLYVMEALVYQFQFSCIIINLLIT